MPERIVAWLLTVAVLALGAPQGGLANDASPGSGASRAVQEAQASNPAKVIRTMDRDGDGRLSTSEFRGPQQQFPLLDADGDGFVTEAEISAFQARAGGNRPQKPGAATGSPVAAWHQRLPIILTHTHFNVLVARRRDSPLDWAGAQANALKLMGEHGVRAAIIMPTPGIRRRGPGDELFTGLLRVAKKHPDRFRVSGGGESLNGTIGATRPDRVGDAERRAFAARAEQIVAAGAVGFGEFTALHFSFFEGHPFEQARPDHPLFLLLADIAAKHGLPIDLHVEAVARDQPVSRALRDSSAANPERVSENMAALERLLAHNRETNFIWVHLGVDNTGDRTAELTRRMLRDNSNLYISITGFQTASGADWFMAPGRGLNPEWRALILEFPDRFMIGSDTFFQPAKVWHTFPQPLQRAVQIVRQPLLPPAVARKVAFENAQRLFRLNVIGADDYPLPSGQAERATAPAPVPDADEMIGPRGLTARQMIGNNDQDGDGSLTQSEFRGPAPQFRMLDGNGDAVVTREEIEAVWRSRMAQ